MSVTLGGQTLRQHGFNIARGLYRRLNRRLFRRIDLLLRQRQALVEQLRTFDSAGVTTRGGLLNDIRQLAHHMRKRGDLEGALYAFRLASQLRVDGDELGEIDGFMTELIPVVQQLIERRPGKIGGGAKPKAVLSLVAWGGDYVRVFTQLLLPSLLAPGNLPGLAERRDIVFYVVTTEKDRAAIEAAESFRRASAFCTFEFRIFPDALLRTVSLRYEDPRRYWLYGALQQVTVLHAQDLEADLFLMTPDTVYAQGTLTGLLDFVDNGKDAVLMTSIRTVRETILPALAERIDAEGRLSLGARELVNAAVPHLHVLHKRCFMSPQNRDFLVGHVNLYWEAPHAIVVHAAHLLPAIVSRRLLTAGVALDYYTIDTALMTRSFKTAEDLERLEVLKAFDPVGYIELTPASRKAPHSGTGFPFETFGRDHFWGQCDRLNLWLFQQRLTIATDVQPGVGARSLAEVDADVERIVAGIEGAAPGPGGTTEIAAAAEPPVFENTTVLAHWFAENGRFAEAVATADGRVDRTLRSELLPNLARWMAEADRCDDVERLVEPWYALASEDASRRGIGARWAQETLRTGTALLAAGRPDLALRFFQHARAAHDSVEVSRAMLAATSALGGSRAACREAARAIEDITA